MRRFWLVGALVLVLAGLLVATGGLSATEMDRNVQAHVTADEESQLAIVPLPPNGHAGERVSLFRVTDNFDQDVDIDSLYITAQTSNVSLVRPGPRPVDDTTVVVLHCDGTTDGPVPVTVYIEASGPGVSVELSRTTHMTCGPPPGQSAESSPSTPFE
jgi:hypothetical protein